MVEKIAEALEELSNNNFMYLIIILIFFDSTLGFFNSIKNRKISSCVGINGIFKKMSILLTFIMAYMIDCCINVNLIGFIPKDKLAFLGITDIGFFEIFGAMLIAFESISVLKNISLAGIPIPKFLKENIEKFLNSFTNEIK